MEHKLKRLGAELRAARKRRGWTLERTGARVGVAIQTVHDYETGKNEPGALRLFALAKVLRLDVNKVARRVERRAA